VNFKFPSIAKFLLNAAFVFAISSCKKNDDQISPPPTPAPKVPIVLTNPVSDLSLFSVTFNGKIVDTGGSRIIEVGFVVDTVPNPTTTKNFDKFIRQANSNGEFTAIIIHVPADKNWYIKAYAINNQGTGYGKEINFKSLPEKPYWGLVTLTNQQEVNAFGANNYTTIYGSIFISGTVTDLTPLQSIVSIGSGLEIVNTQLSNLNGLHNLEMIGRDFVAFFKIERNHSLTNMVGLTKLKIVNGDFMIYNNDGLINLVGLNNFTTSANFDFRIDGCDQLTSITGLEKMQHIYGGIVLKDNPLLNNLDAWNNLNLVLERISVINNSSLQRINCFANLKKIQGIELLDNPVLFDIGGLRNLDTIEQVIRIENNAILSDLSAFSNIITTEQVMIKYNNNLQSIEGLNNLQTTKDGVEIAYNPVLTNLQGLRRFKSTRRLMIVSNNSLINLNGLDSLNALTGGYTAELNIAWNPQLQNLDALQKLTTVNGSVQIFSNTTLSNFCGLKPLFVAGYNNFFSVQNNAINPTPAQIISGCP
jgi:hypothetical protein